MFEINNYYSFILAIILFQLFPGPGTICILNSATNYGAKKAMHSVLGILTGDFIYMTSAVFGLDIFLKKFPLALKSLQYIGVFYLCYLGLEKLIKKNNSSSYQQNRKNNNFNLFKEALAICLTNPKAIMFFVAFFPLFLLPNSKPSTLFVMMLHISIISLIYQTLLVLTGAKLSFYISKWRYSKKIARYLTGFGFIAFALKLAKGIK